MSHKIYTEENKETIVKIVPTSTTIKEKFML